jgi:hypothetical protein
MQHTELDLVTACIDASASTSAHARKSLASRQSTDSVLVVRPACFGFNVETAASNSLQRRENSGDIALRDQARREFDTAVDRLQGAGIYVEIVADDPERAAPDAVFPNNWVSFHADGTAVLYPMLAPSRRRERRPELLAGVVRQAGFSVRRIVDLSALERQGGVLEGTGSLVFCHPERLALAAWSPRTIPAVAQLFVDIMGYRVIGFRTDDGRGRPYYHTNVVLSAGSHVAVVCADAIPEPTERARVLQALEASSGRVVRIDRNELSAFAANCLELATPGGPRLVISVTALAALAPPRRRALEAVCGLLPVDVTTIERIGGGGVRCMLAEIHLPRRSARLAPA